MTMDGSVTAENDGGVERAGQGCCDGNVDRVTDTELVDVSLASGWSQKCGCVHRRSCIMSGRRQGHLLPRPAIEGLFNLAPHRLSCLAPLPPTHQQLVVIGMAVANVGDGRQPQRVLLQIPPRRAASNPAAGSDAGVPSNVSGLFRRAAWK